MKYTVDEHGIVELLDTEIIETEYEITPILEQT